MILRHRLGDELNSTLFNQLVHDLSDQELVLFNMVVEFLLKHVVDDELGDAVLLESILM